MKSHMNIEIRPCSVSDVAVLSDISYRTFDETFRPFNTPENMQAYLEKAYTTEKLTKELENPHCKFYFLFVDGQLEGYLKLNEGGAQTELNDENAIEIERIYLEKSAQGRGLGAELMNFSIKLAKELGRDYIWLGVWEHNEKALHFYTKNGFSKIGEHAFYLGEDRQIDFILKKMLK